MPADAASSRRAPLTPEAAAAASAALARARQKMAPPPMSPPLNSSEGNNKPYVLSPEALEAARLGAAMRGHSAFAQLLAAKLHGGQDDRGRTNGASDGSDEANIGGDGFIRAPVEGGAPTGTVRAAAARVSTAAMGTVGCPTSKVSPTAASETTTNAGGASDSAAVNSAALMSEDNSSPVVQHPPTRLDSQPRPRRSRSADAVVPPGRVNDAVADLDFSTILVKTRAAVAAASPPQPQLEAQDDCYEDNDDKGSGGSSRHLDFAHYSSSPARGRSKAVSAAVSHFDRRASTRSQLRHNGRTMSMGRVLPVANPSSTSSPEPVSSSSHVPAPLVQVNKTAAVAGDAPANTEANNGVSADVDTTTATVAPDDATQDSSSRNGMQRLNNRRASSVDRLSSNRCTQFDKSRSNDANLRNGNNDSNISGSNVSGNTRSTDRRSNNKNSGGRSASQEPTSASMSRSTLWERLPSSKLATLPKAPNEVAAWRAERRARRSRTKARNATIWALLAQGNVPAEAATPPPESDSTSPPLPPPPPPTTTATMNPTTATSAASSTDLMIARETQAAKVPENSSTIVEATMPPPPQTIAVSPMISAGYSTAAASSIPCSSSSKDTPVAAEGAAPLAETHLGKECAPSSAPSASARFNKSSSDESVSQSTSISVPSKRFGVSQLPAWNPPPSPPPSPPHLCALTEAFNNSKASPLEVDGVGREDGEEKSSSSSAWLPEPAPLPVASVAQVPEPIPVSGGSSSSVRDRNTRTSETPADDSATEAASTPPRRSSSLGHNIVHTPPSLGSSLRKRVLLDSPGMSRSGLGIHDNDDNFPLDDACLEDEVSVSDRYHQLMSLEAEAFAFNSDVTCTTEAETAAKEKNAPTPPKENKSSDRSTSTMSPSEVPTLAQPSRHQGTATNRKEAARMSVMQQLNRARRARADATVAAAARKGAGKNHAISTARTAGSSKSALYSGESFTGITNGMTRTTAHASADPASPAVLARPLAAGARSPTEYKENAHEAQNQEYTDDEEAQKVKLTAETLLAVEALATERRRAEEAAESQAKAKADAEAAAAQREEEQAAAVAAAAAAEAAAEAKQKWRDETVAAKLAREQAAAAQAAVEKTTAAKAAADAAFAASNEAARQAQRAKLAAFQVRRGHKKCTTNSGSVVAVYQLLIPCQLLVRLHILL